MTRLRSALADASIEASHHPERPVAAERLNEPRAADVAPGNAGVRFPPPFVYAIVLAVAWGIDRWHPWRITAGPSSARLAAAALGVFLFLLFFVGAFSLFRRMRTSIVPNRPTTALVTDGVYRFTRNPMYVSLVVLYLAAALVLNTWWGLVLLPLAVIVIDRSVIAREERYLTSAFPAEYAAYRARVRRWL